MFEFCKNSSYGIQFDLKKFYFHIPVHKDYKKFFGFSFVMNDHGPIEYFIWNVMPYGYTKAPLISRHLMKPLITKWRKLHINICVYFDDGFSVSNDSSFLQRASLQIMCDLLRAGLTPGLEKCHWYPEKVLYWLGLEWNFNIGCIKIIQRRKNKLFCKIESLKKNWPAVTYREISKVTGLLNSMFPVFNGREQLYSRFLQ